MVGRLPLSTLGIRCALFFSQSIPKRSYVVFGQPSPQGAPLQSHSLGAGTWRFGVVASSEGMHSRLKRPDAGSDY